MILIDETNIMEEIYFCKEPIELCLYIRVNSLIFWRSANMNLKNCLDNQHGFSPSSSTHPTYDALLM